MNKKSILMGVIALIASSAYFTANAQVGINTQTPRATLDVVSLNPSGTTVEGIMAPQLTGAQLKAKDALYTASQSGTIIYATSASPDSGVTGAKTENVGTAGYYYFNGAVWISISGGTSSVIADGNTLYGNGFGLGQTTGTGGNDYDFYLDMQAVADSLPANTTYVTNMGDSIAHYINQTHLGDTISQFINRLADQWFYMPSIAFDTSNPSTTTVLTVDLYSEYKEQFTNGIASSSGATVHALADLPAANQLDYFVTGHDPAVFQIMSISNTGIMSYKVLATATDATFINIVFKKKTN